LPPLLVRVFGPGEGGRRADALHPLRAECLPQPDGAGIVCLDNRAATGATMKNYLSVRLLHERLNRSVSLRQLYTFCEQGHDWATKKLGKWLVDVDAFQAWLDAPTQETPLAQAPPPSAGQHDRQAGRPTTKAQRGRPPKKIELW
jgi:hypothetical protein